MSAIEQTKPVGVPNAPAPRPGTSPTTGERLVTVVLSLALLALGEFTSRWTSR